MKKNVLFYGRFELPNNNALAHRVRANAVALVKCGYKAILVGYTKGPISPKPIHDSVFEIDYYSIKYPKKQYEWFF